MDSNLLRKSISNIVKTAKDRVVSNLQWAGQQAQKNMPASTAFVKELYKGPQTFGKGFAETIRTAAPSVFGPSNLSLQQSYAKTLQDVGQKNIQRGYQTGKRNLVNSGQKLLNTGAQQYQGAAQGAKQSAINVGLGGIQSAMPVFGAQYALKNPAMIGLGGALSGTVNKLQGGSFREGFGQGAASMLRDSSIYQATNPLIAGVTGAAKTAGILKTPLQKFIVGSVLSGIGNMGEDEITNNLLQNPRSTADRVLSFGLGAVASMGGGKIEDWRALKKSTRKAIVNAADKAGYLTKSAKDVWVGAPDVPAFLYDSWNQLKRAGWDGTPNFKNQGGFIDFNAEILPKMKTDVDIKPKTTLEEIKARNAAAGAKRVGTGIDAVLNGNPTLKAEIDNAFAKGDMATVQKLLPQVPEQYKANYVTKTVDPLIQEARKYKSSAAFEYDNARKFFNGQDGKLYYDDGSGVLKDLNKMGYKNVEDIYNQATKGEAPKLSDNLTVKDAYGSSNMGYNIKGMEKRAKEIGYNLYDALLNRVDSQSTVEGRIKGYESILDDLYGRKYSPTQMTRQEKVAKDMLKRGDITKEGYNDIAMKNEGVKPIPVQEMQRQGQSDLEKEVYLTFEKTKDFKKATTKFWELIGADKNNPNATRTQRQAVKETSKILRKYQNNPRLLNATQGIPNGRISGTPQGVSDNKQFQITSPQQTVQQAPIQTQPKSGISKIGEPPVQSSSQGIINKVKNYANQLYTQAIDRYHPLSVAAKRAGEDQAMRNALTQHYGAGSTATYHVDFELSPILKEVNADDLRSYTIAQRDIELAGRNIKGSDREAAQSVIDGLKKKYGTGFGKIEETAKKLYAYQDSLVKKYLVDTGIISKENYDAMRRNNQAYIPFKRVMDQVDTFLGVTPQTKGAGSVSSQSVIKKIKGSERDIIDPLQSIVENTYKIVSVGQRNKVASTIVSLKNKLPDLVRPFTGEVGNRQDIISVFENGKVQKYQVPKDVAEAAKGLNEESLNALVKILAVPSKLVRATATGINPEFLLPNVARDLQSAFVNVGLNPLRFVRGVAHLVKKDEVYQDFLRSGGKTSSIMIDRPYLQKTVGEITGKPGLEVLNPIRLLQTLGEYSEQPTRIAIFEQTKNNLLKQGLSLAEAEVRATNAAQEGTVNFARMGSKMKATNALVTFLNARVQGADQLIRNVKNKPASTLFRLGLITQIPAVLSYLHNRMYESYNNERVVSKYDKQNNFIIMLSDRPIEKLGGAQFIKIPKGDVGRFANPTENFLSYLDGKGDNNAILEIAKAFGGLSPFQNIGDAIPAAIKPPIEWAANRSFFTDQPLVPEYKQALPPKYQYTSKTAPLYKIIGDKLNLSPAKLENTTAGYLTGFEKLGNTAFNAITGQKPDSQQGSDINRTPVARRFLGGEKRTSDEQAIIDDKRASSIDFQINDIKGAVNRGDLPMNEGVNEIQKLRQEQQNLRTTVNPSTQSGGVYYFQDEEGKLKEINLTKVIAAPKLTGNTELDKIAVSKYKSALTKRANDIYALYEAGQMGAQEASKEIAAIKAEASSLPTYKAPKKIAIKKISVPKAKSIKLKKPKKIKVKKPKKVKGIRPTKWKTIKLKTP